MITNNLNGTDKNHVMLGNADDVCVLCAHTYATENKKSLSQADRALRGQFEGKKLFRIPLNGFRVTICMDHIHQIADANPKENGDVA